MRGREHERTAVRSAAWVATVSTVVHGDFECILYIVSTERGGRLRLISAREATPRERRRYDEAD